MYWAEQDSHYLWIFTLSSVSLVQPHKWRGNNVHTETSFLSLQVCTFAVFEATLKFSTWLLFYSECSYHFVLLGVEFWFSFNGFSGSNLSDYA